MKKSLIILVLLLAAGLQVAQAKETKERKEVSAPSAGDIALGVDLAPAIEYLGKFINNSSDATISSVGGSVWNADAPNALWGSDLTSTVVSPSVSIMGKYMLTDEIGLKANFGFTVLNQTDNKYSADFAALQTNPLSELKVTDTYKSYKASYSLSVGGEYRVGKRRLQGVFGADLLFAKSTFKQEFTWGNGVSEVNQNPANGFEATGEVSPEYSVSYFTKTCVTSRYTSGNMLHAGVGVSAGIEYMLGQQCAIGGSVTIYAIYSVIPEQYEDSKGYNSITGKVESHTEMISPGSTAWSFGTSNCGAKLYMLFYF